MTTETELKELWENTDDEVGIRPTRPVLCPHCFAYGEVVAMIMRRSRLHPVADVRAVRGTEEHRPWAFDVAFKCPKCDHFTVFGVPTELEYSQKVAGLRKGREWVLPMEEWEQNKEVMERLKKLGYF